MRKSWIPLAFVLLASCVSAPPAPPPAAPPPAPSAPPPPVVREDWRDIPLTPGSWAYVPDAAGSSALFGRAGAEADFILRCDRANRSVVLSRAGTAAAGTPPAIGITTSAGSQSFAANAVAGAPPRFAASVRASDPFLDKIAFSRGRFVVTGGGTMRLVLPAWAEVARTIEDCRK